jgi:hypothetical protein
MSKWNRYACSGARGSLKQANVAADLICADTEIKLLQRIAYVRGCSHLLCAVHQINALPYHVLFGQQSAETACLSACP